MNISKIDANSGKTTMRAMIRGSGSRGKRVYDLLMSRGDIDVSYFTDRKPERWGKTEDDIPVMSTFYAKSGYKRDFDCIFVPASYGSDAIEQILREYSGIGIDENDIYIVSMECLCGENDDILTHWNDVKQLRYIDYQICDHCNLNCKGCAHFSPLFDQVGVDFNGCIEDIRKVRNKVSNIARLDLLGGEPLLNPELSEYVKTVRTLLPDTRISIFTNGLLIPTLSDDTLKTISTQQVAFMISEYPETSKMLIRIKGILQENKIRYLVTPIRNQFNIPISITEKSRYPHRCISDGCVSISDGKIARCPTLLYLHKFNETFSKSLPEDGILDLDETISGEAFLKKMEERVPLCGYCIEKSIVWELCSRPVQLEDFAVYE